VPSGDLAAILRVAVGCAIEKYGKRKGARAPAKEPKTGKAIAASAPGGPAIHSSTGLEPVERRASRRCTIPAAVRREVWRRDGGRCTYVSPDGQRCPAASHLEYDHIRPVALGGDSTVGNVRIACKPHNLLHAERIFGRDYMERFRRTREPEVASPGRSG